MKAVSRLHCFTDFLSLMLPDELCMRKMHMKLITAG